MLYIFLEYCSPSRIWSGICSGKRNHQPPSHGQYIFKFYPELNILSSSSLSPSSSSSAPWWCCSNRLVVGCKGDQRGRRSTQLRGKRRAAKSEILIFFLFCQDFTLIFCFLPRFSSFLPWFSSFSPWFSSFLPWFSSFLPWFSSFLPWFYSFFTLIIITRSAASPTLIFIRGFPPPRQFRRDFTVLERPKLGPSWFLAIWTKTNTKVQL